MNAVATSPVLPAALTMALDDEYRARATYQAVIDAHGPVTPFVNIVQAEQRHIDALLPLFVRYGVAPPADRWSGHVAAPASLQQACEAGVAGEIRNYQMYDRLLGDVSEPDARLVFSSLRNASAYHHLPAFQACAGANAMVPAQAVAPSFTAGDIADSLRNVGIGMLAAAGVFWLLAQLNRPVGSRD